VLVENQDTLIFDQTSACLVIVLTAIMVLRCHTPAWASECTNKGEKLFPKYHGRLSFSSVLWPALTARLSQNSFNTFREVHSSQTVSAYSAQRCLGDFSQVYTVVSCSKTSYMHFWSLWSRMSHWLGGGHRRSGVMLCARQQLISSPPAQLCTGSRGQSNLRSGQ
jgi:hypothetical protein